MAPPRIYLTPLLDTTGVTPFPLSPGGPNDLPLALETGLTALGIFEIKIGEGLWDDRRSKKKKKKKKKKTTTKKKTTKKKTTSRIPSPKATSRKKNFWTDRPTDMVTYISAHRG